MKPKIVHQEAMDFSFKAKQALLQNDYSTAFELFNKAAELESQVADFYFDKPDLEPTRSIIIRSAAYLNIKAGQIEQAKKYIFFGLLNTSDKLIKEQLNNALELAVSLGSLNPNLASREFNYLSMLRQRSIHYVIEPAEPAYGHSVSLESIKDFTDGYLKSLNAYAISKFRKLKQLKEYSEIKIREQIEKLANPLVTSSAYGSFKFSIANDFLSRANEEKEFFELKSNIVVNYHHEIFINPLSDSDIANIKKMYSDDEVNEIFRPLTKIKSSNSSFNIGYYDTEDFTKKTISKIINRQKKQLLTTKLISQEDIGELESSLVHKRGKQGGKMSKQVIFKELLKTAEYDIKVSEIKTRDANPLLLSEEIIVNMYFNSNKGFTFSFSDLNIQNTDTQYQKALEGFYTAFYLRLKDIASTIEDNTSNQNDIKVASKLVGNLNALSDNT